VSALRIGTRRSSLAIAQAEEIAALLLANGVDSELVPMSTSGDEGAGRADSPQGLKGLWIDSILDALENGEIDVAVHSAKDLPAEEEDGFVIAAVPRRADPSDVMILRGPGSLGEGARVGTSSVRRAAQVRAMFPGVEIVELRGNVDTRLRKLAEGEADAAVLAAAGLSRLGLTPPHAQRLTEMVPAPGQGCLAAQCRDDDHDTFTALAALEHRESRLAFEAERSLMWRLGGGCALPLGALAEVAGGGGGGGGGGGIALTAIVCLPDGSRLLRASAEAATPEDAASRVAKELIDAGAEQILAEVREA